MTDSTPGHTPGPWMVHPESAHVMSSELDDDHDLIPICAMLWPTALRSEEVTYANARLIAASPALLEALEELFERGPVQIALAGNPNACEALEAKCRAAIRLARGEA